ncbi:MAG: hypothetical protein R3F60_29635 [bacterium]
MRTLLVAFGLILLALPGARGQDAGRPGLRLAQARQLLAAGDLAGAEALVRGVLSAWPDAARARLLLAQIARARGDEATARRLIAEVEARGPRLARLEAQALRAPETPVSVIVRLGAQHDSRAVSTPVVEVSPPTLGDVPAARGLLAVELGVPLGPVDARLGVERSLHFAVGEEADMAKLDRTALWIEGRAARSAGPARLGIAALARAALAGRPGEVAYGGPGLAAWAQLPGPATTPWLRVSALGLALADADPLAWAEAEAGADIRLGALAVGPAISVGWLGPDGWREAGASARIARPSGPAQPALAGGATVRDDGRGLRPHAAARLRIPLGDHVATALEAAWQAVSGRNRFLTGLFVEVSR